MARWAAADGPHKHRARSGRTYKGSRKRIARLTWHQDVPVAAWIVLVFLLVILLLVVSWLAKQPLRSELTAYYPEIAPRSLYPAGQSVADRLGAWWTSFAGGFC